MRTNLEELKVVLLDECNQVVCELDEVAEDVYRISKEQLDTLSQHLFRIDEVLRIGIMK